MPTTIKEVKSGTVLARSAADPLRYEGNLYFDAADVRAELLEITPRTYTCSYKGTCNWVDFKGPDGRVVKDVAWVYPTTKAGHEAIAGRYGFHAGRRPNTIEEQG